ncbi:BPL-N domain-containing protein [Granulicella cerasi]|uniref:BPL-N domain-containing protein n=1 Tax=Granulicella cerasi TaxID=741063 RepID=A0ABW1Z9K5_9BACT|nr:BPL-N domain-containing protein [Granulicella cerasi]
MNWTRGVLFALSAFTTVSMAQEAAKPETKPIRVAVYDDKGSPRTPRDFARVFGDDTIHFQLANVTAEQIRAGALKDFDVIVQGGGGSKSQAEQLQPEGREAIREFVRNGGGYLGICAGAYLAASDKDYQLKILNARVVDREHWARGRGDVELGYSRVGMEQDGQTKNKPIVMYHQGPLLAPDDAKDLPPYTMVAQFDSEVALKGAPHGVMVGTTAMASGQFGSGRVFVISPHPEQTPGHEDMVKHAVEWVAKRR